MKATRPYELWETDLTFVWCGIDGWSYLLNVLDVFQREWVAYAFDTPAVKENAIMFVNNALASHPEADMKCLPLRCDNGSQYTSRAFRESMRLLGVMQRFIAHDTPEQNGFIESFHGRFKREYVWLYEFHSFQDADRAVSESFVDYNQNRPHSSLGHVSPYEFLAKLGAEGK